VQAPTTKVKANIPSYASMVGDTPKLTKTISESCKRPESKPKPQHQSKPPTKQQSSSYGKSGFRGLQLYPCIDVHVSVSQEPQSVNTIFHDQESQLHDETAIKVLPHDQSVANTDESVFDVLPDNQFVTMPLQSDENVIMISTHAWCKCDRNS